MPVNRIERDDATASRRRASCCGLFDQPPAGTAEGLGLLRDLGHESVRKLS